MENVVAMPGELSPREKILWMSLFVPGINGRRGLSYCIVGDPGTAKTSILHKLANMAGLPFFSVIGSLRSQTDFLGLPTPGTIDLNEVERTLSEEEYRALSTAGTGKLKFMSYAPAGFAVQAALAGDCLINFDEANTSRPAVQAAMLRVLLEGVVGEMPLSPGARMLLAMNETADAAGGHDISTAMANRIGWLPWSPPTVDTFCDRLVSGCRPTPFNGGFHARHAAEVDAAWGQAWAEAAGRVVGFLRKKPSALHAKPQADSPSAHRAWPSARTWELATRAQAGCIAYGLGELESSEAIGAWIGEGTYAEYMTWVRDNDLPDPADLLDGKVSFKPNPARIDRTAAVLSACTALMTSLPEGALRDARKPAVWGLVQEVAKTAMDLTVTPIKTLCEAGMAYQCEAAYKAMSTIKPVTDVLGLGAR